jgi:hypothetical protein
MNAVLSAASVARETKAARAAERSARMARTRAGIGVAANAAAAGDGLAAFARVADGPRGSGKLAACLRWWCYNVSATRVRCANDQFFGYVTTVLRGERKPRAMLVRQPDVTSFVAGCRDAMVANSAALVGGTEDAQGNVVDNWSGRIKAHERTGPATARPVLLVYPSCNLPPDFDSTQTHVRDGGSLCCCGGKHPGEGLGSAATMGRCTVVAMPSKQQHCTPPSTATSAVHLRLQVLLTLTCARGERGTDARHAVQCLKTTGVFHHCDDEARHKLLALDLASRLAGGGNRRAVTYEHGQAEADEDEAGAMADLSHVVDPFVAQSLALTLRWDGNKDGAAGFISDLVRQAGE